jgi:N-acetylneuraminic acid mutarotase
MGRHSYSNPYLPNVEFLCTDKTESRWQSGPNLPKRIAYSALVIYENTLLLVGGEDSGRVKIGHLYKLSSPDGSWIEMKQILESSKSISYCLS